MRETTQMPINAEHKVSLYRQVLKDSIFWRATSHRGHIRERVNKSWFFRNTKIQRPSIVSCLACYWPVGPPDVALVRDQTAVPNGPYPCLCVVSFSLPLHRGSRGLTRSLWITWLLVPLLSHSQTWFPRAVRYSSSHEVRPAIGSAWASSAAFFSSRLARGSGSSSALYLRSRRRAISSERA